MSQTTPPSFEKESMIPPAMLSSLGLLSLEEWRELLPILDGAQGVVTLYDRNLRVVYISPSITQITGLTTAYYQGKTISETISVLPSARMRWEAIVTSVFKTGEPFSGELEVPTVATATINPPLRRWQLVARPLSNCPECGGNCTCGSNARFVVVIANDITERVRLENALAAHEKRFQRMASNVLGFVYQFALNAEGAVWFQHFSGNCRAFFGLEESALRTNAAPVLQETIHPDDYPVMQDKLHQSAMQLSPFLWKGRFFHEDRQAWRWLEVFSIPERDEQTNTILWDGLMIDVTEREDSSQRLRSSEERYRLLAEATDDIVSLHDLEHNVLYLSPSFEKVTGYSEEVFIRHGLSLLLPRHDTFPHDFLVDARANHGTTTFEWGCKCHDGSLKWLETTVKLLTDSTEGPYNRYLCVSHDMTERHRAAEALFRQARYDSLTGLPNRVYFTQAVREAITEAEAIPRTHLAILLLDVDGFKYINDVLGHDVGDALLCVVSERLRTAVPPDAIIARLSGDEFTVLLSVPEKGVAAVVEAAQAIVQSFTHPVEVMERELFITASIGGAVYPEDGQDAASLLRAADRAMYQAKNQGRNTYCLHTKAMNAATQKRLALENHLHRAIEKNELSLAFQPQVSLLSGKIVGVEALLRWENPDLGNVPCTQFIPLAEETGLIRPLGEWGLRLACDEAVRWQKKNDEPLRVSVNLSARQLGQPGLIELVHSVLRETGLPPACLELELTESALIWNGPASAFTLQSLKRLGIRLSVDDFGTGYSALSYLRRFPLDAVKIDRTFIQELEHNPQTQAIVRGVVDLSHSLDLEVIAEGVETVSQRSLLTALGCDAMQGYFFARPLSAHDFATLLANHNGE